MKTLNDSKLGGIIAIVTFLISTTIFIAYCFSGNEGLIYFSFFISFFLFPLNIWLIISIALKVKRRNEERKTNIKSLFFMVINMLIISVYFSISSILGDYMRICFVNKTNIELFNIEITGCESKRIEKLNIGQSETIWINVSNDCPILIQYNVNGKIKNEIVMGSLSGVSGYRSTYDIK